MSLKSSVIWVISVFLALLELILVLRLFLLALGAGTGNSLVNNFYYFTYFFVRPFEGIFADWVWPGGKFEMATAIAMILSYIVCKFLLWVLSEKK